MANFLLLVWIGSKPVEEPFIFIGQLSSIFYFAYFLVIIPFIGELENKLIFSPKREELGLPLGANA